MCSVPSTALASRQHGDAMARAFVKIQSCTGPLRHKRSSVSRSSSLPRSRCPPISTQTAHFVSRPVDASSSTSVCSRRPRVSTGALISVGVSRLGGGKRFEYFSRNRARLSSCRWPRKYGSSTASSEGAAQTYWLAVAQRLVAGLFGKGEDGGGLILTF